MEQNDSYNRALEEDRRKDKEKVEIQENSL